MQEQESDTLIVVITSFHKNDEFGDCLSFVKEDKTFDLFNKAKVRHGFYSHKNLSIIKLCGVSLLTLKYNSEAATEIHKINAFVNNNRLPSCSEIEDFINAFISLVKRYSTPSRVIFFYSLGRAFPIYYD